MQLFIRVRCWILPMLIETEYTEFQAASNFGTHFVSFITIFWKKNKQTCDTHIISSEEEVGTVEPIYVTRFFLHCTQKALVSCTCFFVCLKLFPVSMWLSLDWKSCDHHFSWKNGHKQSVKYVWKCHQTWDKIKRVNGFSSRGTPSNRPDLQLIPQPKG